MRISLRLEIALKASEFFKIIRNCGDASPNLSVRPSGSANSHGIPELRSISKTRLDKYLPQAPARTKAADWRSSLVASNMSPTHIASHNHCSTWSNSAIREARRGRRYVGFGLRAICPVAIDPFGARRKRLTSPIVTTLLRVQL